MGGPMNRFFSKERDFTICAVALMACFGLSIYNSVHIFSTSFFSPDFMWIWRDLSYFTRGIDPIDVAQGRHNFIQAIGPLDPDCGLPPWTYLLVAPLSLFFVPFRTAYVIAMFLFAFIVISVAALVYLRTKTQYKNEQYSIISAVIVLTSPGIIPTIAYGNYGSIFGCLIIAAIFLKDDHPIFSGVLLGIACGKPQLAFLFIIAFAIDKRWKSILTAGIIVGGSAILAGAIIQKSPITMFIEMYSQGTHAMADIGIIYGIWQPLLAKGYLTTSTTLALSMLTGFIFVIGFCVAAKKWIASEKQALLYYSIPAVATIFWCYSSAYDHTVLALVGLAAVELIFKREKTGPRYTVIMLSGIYFYCLGQIGFINPIYNALISFNQNFAASLVYYWLNYFMWIIVLFLLFSAARARDKSFNKEL